MWFLRRISKSVAEKYEKLSLKAALCAVLHSDWNRILVVILYATLLAAWLALQIGEGGSSMSTSMV